MQWYYARGGQTLGPVGFAVLVDMARSGALGPSDMVCNTSTGQEWTSASNIQGLFAGAQASVPPAPAPVPYVPAGTHLNLSLTPNRDLMRFARESLRGRWGLGVGVTVLYLLLAYLAGATVVGFLVLPSLILGLTILFLSVARRREAATGQLFQGFNAFGTALGAYFLMGLFVFLWSLLLLVPGIIAAYSYSLTFFIIADEPGVGVAEAIRRSKLMMQGNKWKLFCLQMRFFWWALLCELTLGIGLLWLVPYMQTAQAYFYDDIRNAAAQPVAAA